MTLIAPVEGITHRVQEIGRIRMGEKGPKGAPVKLKTFRLTANDRRVLEAAAALYGGDVREWRDAPDEGFWQLTTAAAELDILIPRALRSVSQSWELWQGGTCIRRCDGRVESVGGTDCICGPERGSDDQRFCDILTRVSVILPRLPGLGVWRLDTGGFHAATTIPATVDLMLALDPRPMVPAVLRAVQASTKVRDENGRVITHRFVKPMLDAPGITIGQLVGSQSSEPLQIEDGAPRAQPPTSAERVARQRAEVEARRAAPAQDAPQDVEAAFVDLDAPGKPEPGPQPAVAATVPVRCTSVSPYEGAEQCARETGHAGNHKSHSRESWA